MLPMASDVVVSGKPLPLAGTYILLDFMIKNNLTLAHQTRGIFREHSNFGKSAKIFICYFFGSQINLSTFRVCGMFLFR